MVTELITRYYYCGDYDTYFKVEQGCPIEIKNGKEVFNMEDYAEYMIGELWYEQISKEEYYRQLENSKKEAIEKGIL